MAFKMAAKSPLMKKLAGAQEKLPEGLRNIIEAEPESPAKNMNKGYGTPSPMKAEMALSIEDSNYKKEVKAAKKSSPAKQTTKGVIKKTVKITPTRKIKSTKTSKKKSITSPAKKSKSKVEQDYARNAIADYKRGDKKAAGYEKKKALEVAAGEGK